MSGSFTDPQSVATERLLKQFDEVFLKHDPAALAALVADDCVIENTHFENEDVIARGDRGEIRWRLVLFGAGEFSAWRKPDACARRQDCRGSRLCERAIERVRCEEKRS